MGPLEDRALPSLRDVALDSVLFTFSNRSVLDRGKCWGPSGQAAWTVHHVQNYNLRGVFPLASQAGRRVGSHSSLRSHWFFQSLSRRFRFLFFFYL
jgi:hypothetical protein